MQIERIPFPPIGSNMYVVTQGRDAIVLDPWPDEATMQRLQGYHALIVLTHEHIDHISGLGRMQRALGAHPLAVKLHPRAAQPRQHDACAARGAERVARGGGT